MRVSRSPLRPAIGLVLGACLSVACASPVVGYDFDPEADFSGFTTFRWIEPSEMDAQPRVARQPLVDARIRREVNEGLSERGYRKVDSGPSDFLVIYQAALQERQELIPVCGQAGAVRGIRTYTYPQGTLVLDVYDGVSRRLVWRGSATRAFDDENRAVESIEELVASLVAGFPPPQ